MAFLGIRKHSCKGRMMLNGFKWAKELADLRALYLTESLKDLTILFHLWWPSKPPLWWFFNCIWIWKGLSCILQLKGLLTTAPPFRFCLELAGLGAEATKEDLEQKAQARPQLTCPFGIAGWTPLVYFLGFATLNPPRGEPMILEIWL